MDVARRLMAIQVDLTSHVAPSAEIVFWSRLGSTISREDVADLVGSGELVERRGFLRPAEDMALHTAEMAAWPSDDEFDQRNAAWVADNQLAREQVLERLRADGPLPAKEIDAEFARPWKSTGWNNNKNVPMMLERLEEAGEVAVAHREGRERVWDLASRVYPADTPVPLEDARYERAARRLRSLGIMREERHRCIGEGEAVALVGEPARVEGIRGTWRVDPDLLDQPFRGRVALLSPLDRLVFDRKRMAELFEFDYALEMYKPAEVRRFGYWALPVLHGDQLVGTIDCESFPDEGELIVHRIGRDEGWKPTTDAGVETELTSLAHFLDLELVLF